MAIWTKICSYPQSQTWGEGWIHPPEEPGGRRHSAVDREVVSVVTSRSLSRSQRRGCRYLVFTFTKRVVAGSWEAAVLPGRQPGPIAS